MIPRLFRRIYRNVAEMSWRAIILLGSLHFCLSWLAATFTESSELTAPSVFWYYYLVTATTVGYGDFAPATAWGRAIAVIWIMPGGIALFTTAIAKGAQAMAESWRRNMRGGGDYSKLEGHIVLIGWRGQQSERLAAQLVDVAGAKAHDIVIVAAAVSQNPLPDQAQFVRAESLSDPNAYTRAGLIRARAAIVMAATDADALAASLAAFSIAPDTRLVAYFEDERMAALLKAHQPMAETAPSLSVELLARTALDAGSSEVFFTLASSQDGPTQYSVIVPGNVAAFEYGAAMTALKRDHDATLLGIRKQTSKQMRLNLGWVENVVAGDRLYYVADSRLPEDGIPWSSFALGAK